jgi:hypothetical protein
MRFAKPIQAFQGLILKKQKEVLSPKEEEQLSSLRDLVAVKKYIQKTTEELRAFISLIES